MTSALSWYGNRAADLARYAMSEPPMTEAMMAVVHELALDAGRRSVETDMDEALFQAFWKGMNVCMAYEGWHNANEEWAREQWEKNKDA